MNRFLLCLLLSIATSVLAVDKNPSAYTLTLVPDRPDCLYKRGENVTFTVSVSLNGKPVDNAKVDWSLSNDGKDIQKPGLATLAGGKATISGKLDEPGFLQCRADITPPGEKPKSLRSGVAVDPLEIKPSLPAPEDFDAYWAGERKKLAALPLNIRLTPVKSVVPGVECFDLQADGPGFPLSAYLARPIGAKAGSLPAIVLAHGAGVVGSRMSIAAKWAKDGLLALDFNANGLPNNQPKDFYLKLSRGELKEYYWKGRDSREDTFFHTLFLRLQRAMDALTAQPEWDGKTLIALGRSQGGGQAIVAGGLDPRVTYISAEIPAFCDHTGIVKGRINGWPRLIPNETEKPEEKAINAVRYYDAVNFAARTHAQAFITTGFIDIVCPPTGVYAAYNQLPGKKQIWTHLDTGHTSRADYEARVRDEVLAYLKSRP